MADLRPRGASALLALLLAAVLAACSTERGPSPVIDERVPSGFPTGVYEALAQHGARAYRIDPAQSIAVIRVSRAGALASLGHDHVVAARQVRGFVAPDDGRADFYVALDTMTVDEPALRAQAGFDTQPSPDDVAGTRSNMLDKVLEVDRYPFAVIAVRNAAVDAERPVVVGISLHGTTRPIDVPVHRLEATDREVRASGAFSIAQTDFGITPYALFGGAIAVGDRVDIQFQLVATRIDRSGAASQPVTLRRADPAHASGSATE